jgi:hypothetical protein
MKSADNSAAAENMSLKTAGKTPSFLHRCSALMILVNSRYQGSSRGNLSSSVDSEIFGSLKCCSVVWQAHELVDVSYKATFLHFGQLPLPKWGNVAVKYNICTILC